MTGNEALALGALHAGIKVVDRLPRHAVHRRTGQPVGDAASGRPCRVEHQREGGVRDRRRGRLGRPTGALCHENVRPERRLRLADLNSAFGRHRWAGDLRRRRSGGQRRHGGTGFARLCADVRPADARPRQRAGRLRSDPRRFRPLGSHRLARLRAPGDCQRQLFLCRRVPRRAAGVARTPTAADPRHQRVHQGWRSHRYDPAPRCDRAVGEGGGRGSRTQG